MRRELDSASVGRLTVMLGECVSKKREMERRAEGDAENLGRVCVFSPLAVSVNDPADTVVVGVDESSPRRCGREAVMVSDREKFIVRYGVH